jgi:hypothetical protein
MKRNTKNVKREHDSVIGYVTIDEERVFTDIRRNYENIVYRYSVGERVAIARSITTAAGRSFRIKNTVNWINESVCTPDEAVIAASNLHIDPIVRNPEIANNCISSEMLNDVNRFTNLVNHVKVNNVSGKVSTATKRTVNSNPNNKSKNKTMDKSTLKSVINGLTPGQVVGITFLGDKSHLSRDWTVVKVRTGKGKGGSRLLELVDSARNTITTGTPESHMILNMTVNGTMHGANSESEVPVVYETNAARAAELKETFKALVGAEGDRCVSVASTIADLNGTFTVNRGTQLRGRGGQIRLELERVGSGERVEVWSLRHSGVISSFTVLSDEPGESDAAVS